MTFRHNIAYMVSLFVVSLDITVMINVLQEMMKILHEKMLKLIDFTTIQDSKITH